MRWDSAWTKMPLAQASVKALLDPFRRGPYPCLRLSKDITMPYQSLDRGPVRKAFRRTFQFIIIIIVIVPWSRPCSKSLPKNVPIHHHCHCHCHCHCYHHHIHHTLNHHHRQRPKQDEKEALEYQKEDNTKQATDHWTGFVKPKSFSNNPSQRCPDAREKH